MGVKLQILSDLHLEFGPADVGETDADVIVLAGDIAPGLTGLKVAQSKFPERPVVYVAGNHEYYGQALPELTEALKQEAEGSQVHFLDNREVVLASVRFLGCTLWTDFALFGEEKRTEATLMAAASMNDYRVIRNSENRWKTAAGHHAGIARGQPGVARKRPGQTVCRRDGGGDAPRTVSQIN